MTRATDEEIEDNASGFDDPDAKTSPEVVRAPGREKKIAKQDNPVILIFLASRVLRRKYVELLWHDGWHAVEVKSAEELFETARALAPEVAFIDPLVEGADGSLVDELRHHRGDAAIRVVAVLTDTGEDAVGRAVASGYDDFVTTVDDQMEVLARATANLRVARTLVQINRQRRDAATLLELSQTLASSLDLQLILHTVSRLVAEVIDFERCSIILKDPDTDEAVMVAASEDRSLRDLRISLSNYPEVQQCIRTAAPVLIADAVNEPMFERMRNQNPALNEVRTMALFPVVFEERVTGVLFLRSTKVSRQLGDHEVQFGQTVASACAVAVRNARLFDNFRDETNRINTMRLVAERQMEALRKYEDFFEYAADGMAIVDARAETLYVNRQGRFLLGREAEELKGTLFLDFLTEESRRRWPDVTDFVRHGRFKQNFDMYALRPDGSERIFSMSAGGVGQDMGLVIVSFRDVTETREMELELRTTKDFLENLIDNSVDAIVASDMNGNVMLFNKGAEEIYGFEAEEVIGRLHVADLYPPGVSQDVMRQLRDERWGGRGRLEATRKEILTRGGVAVPVNMTASIIYEDGEEVATVGVFSDLRDRLKMERRLNHAQEELMKTEKARVAAELAGMAAHELNQPLTSVLGYAEMLRHKVGSLDPRMAKSIETIYSQAERMAEIVRKIGRITKYETKHYGASTVILDIDASSSAEDQNVTDKPRRSSRADLDMMNAIAEAQRKRASGFTRGPDTDPRAQVVRLDTLDDVGRPKKQAPDERSTQSDVRDDSVEERGGKATIEIPRGMLSEVAHESREATNPGVRIADIKPPEGHTRNVRRRTDVQPPDDEGL